MIQSFHALNYDFQYYTYLAFLLTFSSNQVYNDNNLYSAHAAFEFFLEVLENVTGVCTPRNPSLFQT